MDTPKLGPKNYKYSLNISSSHIDMLNFFKYQKHSYKFETWSKIKTTLYVRKPKIFSPLSYLEFWLLS